MSPIMIRCSQVTMFRSRLLSTSVIQRGSDHSFQYLATVMQAFRPFICMAPSPVTAMQHAIGKTEFRADGIRNGRAHRGQIAAAAGHHAAADFQIAGIPIGRRAAVGRNDAAIGQLWAQFPENALGIEQAVVAVQVCTAFDDLPPILHVLDQLSPARRDRSCDSSSGISASSVCLASPLRFTSIG